MSAFVFTCLVDFWMVSGLHLQETCSCDACFNFGTKDRGEQQHDTVYVSWASRSVSAEHVCKGVCRLSLVIIFSAETDSCLDLHSTSDMRSTAYYFVQPWAERMKKHADFAMRQAAARRRPWLRPWKVHAPLPPSSSGGSKRLEQIHRALSSASKRLSLPEMQQLPLLRGALPTP